MKRLRIIRCLTLVACVVGATSLFAQTAAVQDSPQNTRPPGNIGMPHQLAVTGCLKRGNEAGTFMLTDQNGKTWSLVPDSSGIDLSKNIFQVVTIGAKEVPLPQQHDAGQTTENSQNVSRVGLRVISLDVVSRSCTR
jgi:hypothetical protein